MDVNTKGQENNNETNGKNGRKKHVGISFFLLAK